MCFYIFGYVKTFKPQMRMCEYETYRAAYCTLCRQLGREYGILSRALLSYDYTFVTLLYMALRGQTPEYKQGRCTFNPLKKCGVCKADRDGFKLASALTVIMFYYRVIDNIADSSWFARFGWRCVKLMAAPLRRKAGKKYPEIDKLADEYIKAQFAAERDENRCIDSLAEPTANMLSELSQMLSEDEKEQRILKNFGYYLGRWIYIIDASDDIENDIKSSGINPFILKFNLNKHDDESIKKAKAYANEILNETISRAITAYELLDLRTYKPILDNIIYMGMGNAQREILHSGKKGGLK